MREIKVTKEYQFSKNAPHKAWCLINSKPDKVILVKIGETTFNANYDPETFGELLKRYNLTIDNYYYEYRAYSLQDMLRVTNPFFDYDPYTYKCKPVTRDAFETAFGKTYLDYMSEIISKVDTAVENAGCA